MESVLIARQWAAPARLSNAEAMPTYPTLNIPVEKISTAQISDLLNEHGIVLLRGHQYTAGDLESLTRRMFVRFHVPANRASLRRQDGDGFSSMVRKDNRLLGHSEAYYRPCLPPPDVCIFACEKAPTAKGGETFIINGAELYRALPADLAFRLETEGIIYESLWPRERWQEEFGVDGVVELKSLLDGDKDCEYTLSSEDELHLFFKTDAIQTGSQSEKRFINGMLAHLPKVDHSRYASVPISSKPTNRMHWGRGGLIENEDICRIIDAHDAVLHKHRWHDGDILMLDNHRVLHGREVLEAPSDRIIYGRFGFWK